MQTEIKAENNIYWRRLDEQTEVGHFMSSSKDGSKVYVKKIAAKNKLPERPICLFLLHDIGQYHGRFAHFVSWAQENNPDLSFVAMDFVGHGLSSGTRGHIKNFDHLVNDFLFLLNQTIKNSEEKWFVLGHGLGGLVALDLSTRHQERIEKKVDGIILSNFILKLPAGLSLLEINETPVSQFILGLFSQARPLKMMKGSELLTDQKSVLAYEHDPLVVQHPTLVSIREIQKKLANIYQDSYFLGKPVLMLRSENNGTINRDGIDYFIKGIKKELLTEKKYSLMKHDLYNDQDKEIVFLDIMDWIKAYESF